MHMGLQAYLRYIWSLNSTQLCNFLFWAQAVQLNRHNCRVRTITPLWQYLVQVLSVLWNTKVLPFDFFHWGCKQDIITMRSSQSGLNLKIILLFWLHIFILIGIGVLTVNQTTLPGIGSWWLKDCMSESFKLVRVYFKIRLDGLLHVRTRREVLKLVN